MVMPDTPGVFGNSTKKEGIEGMSALQLGRLLWGLAVAGLLAASLPAAANSLLIWPIYPVIEQHQRASALWLENRGKNAVTMQLRIFDWYQEGGDDQYRAQASVVGSPPMVEIAPGQRQLVRLTRTAPAPADGEEAFRVVIDEIPAPPTETPVDSPPRAAINLQIRYSLPLFVYGEAAVPPRSQADDGAPYPGLSWRVVRLDDRDWLEIRNTRSRHARLSQVAFVNGDQRAEIAPGLLGYVLAGSTRRWALPKGLVPGGNLRAQILGSERSIAAE